MNVITVANSYPNPAQPYSSEPIPNYLARLTHEKVDNADELNFQKNLQLISQFKNLGNKSIILIFQGRDAAGKTSVSDSIFTLSRDKLVRYKHMAEPKDGDLVHNYLWRFRHTPRFGEVQIYDRGWPERVLTEKVDKLASPTEIKESYAELRTYEWLLRQLDIYVCKFWLEITPEEQKRRFEKRKEEAPWKFSASDTDSEKNWSAYTNAANEMFHRTGTTYSPWYIVSGEYPDTRELLVKTLISREI